MEAGLPPLPPRRARKCAVGNLARFILLPGQRHDSIGVELSIVDIEFAALLADKAFDDDWPRAELDERGAAASAIGYGAG